MSPFPVVRVRGRFTRRGTRITLISMTVPKGARVTLTCRGRSCRVKRKRKTARSTRVRFTELSGTLRPGTLIRIYVEQRGRIGKYARFKIRRGRPPLRSDACLGPGSTRPRPCPD